MLSLFNVLRAQAGLLRRDERGQDAFEYLLVIGVIMVAVVTAVAVAGPGGATPIWNAVQTEVISRIV